MAENSTVMVLGADGYLGFPLSMHLALQGYNVIGVDAFFRRKWVAEGGGHSATPIKPMADRLALFKKTFGKEIHFECGDLREYRFVSNVLNEYRPDTIIHLAEQPSAPFSMKGIDHAVLTQTNNLVGTLNVLHAMKEFVPDCHLVKLGSIGEYGSANTDIPEGFFDVTVNGHSETLMFPRKAFPDWYHWSKVYDSGNIMMACDIWGIRSSDVMQGVVYGTRTDAMVNDGLLSRFDFDAVFGTVINRFCAQAVLGHAITPYGTGKQKRPFISLRDSVQCLSLITANPPKKGEYRVFNQFDEVYSVCDVAKKIQQAGRKLGFETSIKNCENPRVEPEGAPYYNPIHKKLYELGFKAAHTMDEELEIMLNDLAKYKERLVDKKDKVMPKIFWEPGNGVESRTSAGAIPVGR